MTLRLGCFPDFKSTQATVLVEGAPDDLRQLIARLHDFNASPSVPLPIHDLARVSRRYPAKLFVARQRGDARKGFWWVCSAPEIEVAECMLQPLLACRAGHQYFELSDGETQLMVSMNEYGDEWWDAQD